MDYKWREKRIPNSFGRLLHLASIPFILMNHPVPVQKTFYMEMKNEECTMATSREYPTCLALIRYGALNEKINEENPSM